MTALNKKWLSGLVAGALMAVSVGTLAAEQKTWWCRQQAFLNAS